MEPVINSTYAAMSTRYNGSHNLCHATMKIVDFTHLRKPMGVENYFPNYGSTAQAKRFFSRASPYIHIT